MNFKILFLLMQNIVIIAGKEGEPRSRSLTPKSRKIMELEENNAKLEEINRNREDEARKQEELIKKIASVQRCDEVIKNSNNLLFTLDALKTNGKHIMETLIQDAKHKEDNLKKAGGVVLGLAGVGLLGLGVAAGCSVAAGYGTAAITFVGFTFVTSGAIIGTLLVSGAGLIVLGILASIKGFNMFNNEGKELRFAKSDEIFLKKIIENIDKYHKEVEENQAVVQNLIKKEESSSKDCNDALLKLNKSFELLSSEKEQLKVLINRLKITKDDGGYKK